MLGRMMMCGFPKWIYLECFHCLDPASWRRAGGPIPHWQRRYSRFRHAPFFCVIAEYASDGINEVDGNGKAKDVRGALKSALSFASEKCDVGAIWEARKDWGMQTVDDEPGVLLVRVRSYVNACHYWILSIIYEIGVADFSARALEVSIDRTRLTRSASFLVSFIVVHADGKMRVYGGTDDFNGCGYLYDRLCWTGLWIQVNIVDGYVLLSASLHDFVGVKRLWDQELFSGLMSGQ